MSSLPAHSPRAAVNASDDPAALIGRILADRYKVTGLLGVGGIGRVYRAEHLVLRRPVALKVLLEHYQCVPELQRRFEREAMALAALSHPNIVTITDFVSVKDVTFLVMELVEGRDLDEMIEKEPLSEEDAFSVMGQILSCLAYAHERDVIHRDLKPQNVLVRRLPANRLHAEILDFGLAKFMDGSGPAQNLTKTGLIVGTPAYMAPEQASGASADQRSDVYAAAIMFFEMLAGAHPFDGHEGSDLLRQHLLTPAPTLRARCPDARIAPELEVFLARALSKDGAQRYADGTAMLEAFHRLPPDSFARGKTKARGRNMETAATLAPTRAASPSAMSSKSGVGRSRVKLWAFLAVISVLLTAGVVIAMIAPWGSDDEVERPRTEAPPRAPPEETPPQAANDSPPEETPPERQAAPPPAIVDEPIAEEEAELLEEEEAPIVAEELSEEEAALLTSDDPSLDEPADAPLEEDVEVPPAPPPPTVRPPQQNPWAGREPSTLSGVHRRVMRGQTITKRHMRSVAAYRRRHPRDVRATLLLAQAYASRGWLSSSLEQYRNVYRRNPAARGDPRMLRDIVRMSGTESLHSEAAAALIEIYGAESIPAIERAIERERAPATQQRLRTALAMVRAAG